MRIGSREVGPGHPCCIVAELSNNHNGSFERLAKLMQAAQAAGADVLKIQAYTPDELVALRGDGPAPDPWGAAGWDMRRLYTKAQTPLSWLPMIAERAATMGIPWFSSVFGPESLAALEAVGCPAYKISHLESRCRPLIDAVLATHKPVVVSCALTKYGEPDYYQADEIVYCPGHYPVAIDEMHLRELEYDENRQNWLGLSSHCRAAEVAPIAVAMGAKYLEYHFHLEAEPSELEANVSLNEREFTAMVQSVRQAEVLLG